jgi:hypothetical protein
MTARTESSSPERSDPNSFVLIPDMTPFGRPEAIGWSLI